MPHTITIEQLFRGLDKELDAAMKDVRSDMRASEVAEKHIAPILDKIEENTGEEMDAMYIAYMLEFLKSTWRE